MYKEKFNRIVHIVLYETGLYLGKARLIFKHGIDDDTHNNKDFP